MKFETKLVVARFALYMATGALLGWIGGPIGLLLLIPIVAIGLVAFAEGYWKGLER